MGVIVDSRRDIPKDSWQITYEPFFGGANHPYPWRGKISESVDKKEHHPAFDHVKVGCLGEAIPGTFQLGEGGQLEGPIIITGVEEKAGQAIISFVGVGSLSYHRDEARA